MATVGYFKNPVTGHFARLLVSSRQSENVTRDGKHRPGLKLEWWKTTIAYTAPQLMKEGGELNYTSSDRRDEVSWKFSLQPLEIDSRAQAEQRGRDFLAILGFQPIEAREKVFGPSHDTSLGGHPAR